MLAGGSKSCKYGPMDAVNSIRRSFRQRSQAHFLLIIAAAEVLFDPDVETDKQVPAPHLPQLELGKSGAPVAPSDGNDGPCKPAHDRFQRKLDREVEVRGKKRAASVDHLAGSHEFGDISSNGNELTDHDPDCTLAACGRGAFGPLADARGSVASAS